MDEDDVAREIAQIQNCQLSSEVKSMLLSSYSADDIVLALEINQPTSSSDADKSEEKLEQAKEAGDAIQDHESPSLPSPQQPKAKHVVDPSTEEKPLFEDDVHHHSKNSTHIEVEQQAMHSNPLQKGKDHDPEENTKVNRDHKLINVDEASEMIEPLSQENQQPKENVALGSKMNLKEKSDSVNGTEKYIAFPQTETSSSSSEIDPEEIAVETDIKASTQVAPTESCRILLEHESFVIKELDSNSNGIKDETIYPQKAICRHCSILISQESRVFNTKCKCTKTSLVHEGCKEAWSLVKGDKCKYCDQQIDCTRVMVSSSEENNEITISTSDRSWCCLW